MAKFLQWFLNNHLSLCFMEKSRYNDSWWMRNWEMEYISQIWIDMGVSINGGYPTWLVYFMENPIEIRMMTRGSPISGNHHIYVLFHGKKPVAMICDGWETGSISSSYQQKTWFWILQMVCWWSMDWFKRNLTETMHHLSSEQCPQWQWQCFISHVHSKIVLFLHRLHMVCSSKRGGTLHQRKATPSFV